MPLRILLLVLHVLSLASAAPPSPSAIQFGANHYKRDLQTNVVIGKGNAWVKRAGKQLWADEIQMDFTTEIGIASGNVHLKEEGKEMWGSHLIYHFKGFQMTIENATIVSRQLVMHGNVIRRLNEREFEIEEGTYSNCNLDHVIEKDVDQCPADWKVFGSYFHVTTEGYAHVKDAVLNAKDTPIFYTPYFIFPVKSQRQSGLLLPRFSYHESLGNGFTQPLYLALGAWHDSTLFPTYYTKRGYHLGGSYRYLYSSEKEGSFNFSFMRRRFGPLPNQGASSPTPDQEDMSRPHLLGIAGEGSFSAENIYRISERTLTRQWINWVSNPYYTRDYGDMSAPLTALRSQLMVSSANDSYLFTAVAQHYQNLILSKDSWSNKQVDQGAPSILPGLNLSRTASRLLGPHLLYEADAKFNNYYRPNSFDRVTPGEPNIPLDVTQDFDYIRTGRRMQLETRLVASIPMPPGFVLQPVAKGGTLLYHFDHPKSELFHQEYVHAEVPFSLYVTKLYTTGILGYEKIRHVFQPRLIYSRSLTDQAADPAHPFFAKKPLPNPRFDINDQITPFEYGRFEIINRLLRKTGGGAERFFLVQVSENYNIKKTEMRINIDDPRYSNTYLGPIELLTELSIWRLGAQVQASWSLEPNPKDPTGNKENSWSSSLTYSEPGNGDSAILGVNVSNRGDQSLNDQVVSLGFYKILPIFFNVRSKADYSLKNGLRGYEMGLFFETKPRSCWGLSLVSGRDAFKRTYATINFKIIFGNPNELNPM